MQYNISPETLLDERYPTDSTVDRILEEEINFELFKDNAVCANGAMYRKDVRGFLPELMEKMYGDRVIFKKKNACCFKQQYEKTPTKALEKEIARWSIPNGKKDPLTLRSAIGNQYFRYYKLANTEDYYVVWSGIHPLD